ncbi:MAG: GNAT family N-acetyltransferase [bacterium]|nr:GNAT family N-acetyltransferase [bacterium]MDY4099380.1 GNAT family N-acetyltransferase [Lachnospiraceae bacterium]
MKIGRLSREQIDFFADMDPLLMLERLEFPNCFALAATETDMQTGEELPAGLMVCAKSDDRLIIEWIYVAPSYRMQGIGEQLLVEAFAIAKQQQLPEICAYVNREFGREMVCPDEEKFLGDHLFDKEQQLPGEWLTDLRTLSEQPYFKQQKERLPIVTPLQQLTRAKLREALDSLASLEGAAMLYSAADAGVYLDEELSFLISAKGEIRGGILVQCISRNLYEAVDDTLVSAGKEQVLCPVYFCAQSVQEEKALIFAAMQAAAKKYAPDTEVHIICRSNGCDRLMHEVLPEDGTPSRLLIADVAEYFDQIEQTDDYLL